MNATDVAVSARLRELADEDGCVRSPDATRARLAAYLGIAESTVNASLRRLEAAEILYREPSAGRAPTVYCFAPQPAGQPADSTVEPAGSNPPDQPAGLAGPLAEADAPETTSSSDPPTATGSDRTGAPEEPAGPGGSAGSIRRVDAPIQNAATAVVIAAADEAKRLGKPPLDEALKTKLGSQAKRMHAGGVAIVDLEAAARYVVEHDMTALDAAHRKTQAATARSIGEIPSLRPTDAEKEDLFRLAAESKASRDPASLSPHREEELIEVWWFVAATWPRAPLLGPAERAVWHEHLRVLPTGCILWALREIARSGERFAPGWGQVWTVGFPKLHEQRVKREMREWSERETSE